MHAGAMCCATPTPAAAHPQSPGPPVSARMRSSRGSAAGSPHTCSVRAGRPSRARVKAQPRLSSATICTSSSTCQWCRGAPKGMSILLHLSTPCVSCRPCRRTSLRWSTATPTPFLHSSAAGVLPSSPPSHPGPAQHHVHPHGRPTALRVDTFPPRAVLTHRHVQHPLRAGHLGGAGGVRGAQVPPLLPSDQVARQP